MFIVTVCLLGIIAWLFFNGLNEKRWVEAHQHDDLVASDEGFLPSFTAITRSMTQEDGKLSIRDENTRFARAVARVQAATSGLNERLERRATAARAGDDASSPPDDFFGRVARSVRRTSDDLGKPLELRMRQARERETVPLTAEDSLIGRIASKVGESDARLGEQMKARYEERVAPGGDVRSVREENTTFGRLVSRMSERTERFDQRIDKVAETGRETYRGPTSMRTELDFVERVASRLRDSVANESRPGQAKPRRSTAAGDSDGTLEQRLAGDDDALSRAAANVSRRMQGMERGLERRVDEYKAREASAPKPRVREDGMIALIASRIGERVKRLDERIDRQMSEAGEKREPSPAARMGDDDFLTRTASKIGHRVNEIDDRFAKRGRDAVEAAEAKLRRSRGPDVDRTHERETLDRLGSDDSFLARAASMLGRGMGGIGESMDRRASTARGSAGDGAQHAESGSLITRVGRRIGAKVKAFDEDVDKRVARAGEARDHAPAPKADEDDLVTRVSRKIGGRVNELDDRLVESSRDLSDKADDRYVETSRKLADPIDDAITRSSNSIGGKVNEQVDKTLDRTAGALDRGTGNATSDDKKESGTG